MKLVSKRSPIAVTVALGLGPVPAFAHAQLRAAAPAVGATVASAPDEVVLHYSEGLEVGLSTIEVRDGAGTRVDTGGVHAVAGNARRMAVRLPKLPPGIYKVIWHATSVDTHRTEGSFEFTVKP